MRLPRPLLEFPGWLRAWLEGLGVALLTLFMVAFAARNASHQGDLRTYLAAGRAVLLGLDPYRPENLATVAGHPVFPFVYPPFALLPCATLAALPPHAVALGWIGCKLALLAVLIVAWKRWFVPRIGVLPLALVALFGWNASAQWDLASGNVALIECALLWAALGCFVSGRRTAFALCIVAAALFKLMPAVFLLLLLVPTPEARPNPRLLGTALVLLAIVTLGPCFVGPASHWDGFWEHVPDATRSGNANPAALGLAMALLERVGLEQHRLAPLALAGWGLYALALIGVSAPLLRELHRRRDAREWVMAAAFLYVLLVPRPMAYGFVLLVPAPLFFLPAPFRGGSGALLLSLMLSAHGLLRLTSIASESLLAIYAPFLLTLCVWMLVLRSTRARAAPAARLELAHAA